LLLVLAAGWDSVGALLLFAHKINSGPDQRVDHLVDYLRAPGREARSYPSRRFGYSEQIPYNGLIIWDTRAQSWFRSRKRTVRAAAPCPLLSLAGWSGQQQWTVGL
jgi:hypothetical protein